MTQQPGEGPIGCFRGVVIGLGAERTSRSFPADQVGAYLARNLGRRSNNDWCRHGPLSVALKMQPAKDSTW